MHIWHLGAGRRRGLHTVYRVRKLHSGRGICSEYQGPPTRVVDEKSGSFGWGSVYPVRLALRTWLRGGFVRYETCFVDERISIDISL
jgi:hypothetical protein